MLFQLKSYIQLLIGATALILRMRDLEVVIWESYMVAIEDFRARASRTVSGKITEESAMVAIGITNLSSFNGYQSCVIDGDIWCGTITLCTWMIS